MCVCSVPSPAAGIARTAISILLVEMEDDRSLLDLVGLGQDLDELLRRRVDI
jgi:predicted nucleotidyltransferase